MATLNFDPILGVQVPEASEVVSDLGKVIQEAFQKNPDDPPLNIEPTSPMGQVVDAFAAEVIAKNNEIAFLANQNNLKTTEGRFLDGFVSYILLSRKLSEATIVQCVCTGLQGTFIPYGVIVEDSNGNQFRHNDSNGVTIPASGSVVTSFASVVHGAIEVGIGTVQKIITVIPGWDSVNNEVVGAVGRERESDTELRARYQNSVAINSTGSVAAIRSNLLNIDGVIDVQVFENLAVNSVELFGVDVPGHGIAVCIFGGDDSAIAEVINKKKMGGTAMGGNSTVTFIDSEHLSARYDYPIYRPTLENFYVKVDFYANSMSDSVKQAVKKAVSDDALGLGDNPRIGLGQTVYADRFRSAIYKVTNVNVRQIQVAIGSTDTWSDRVSIDADVEPSIISNNVSIVLTEP